MSTTKDLDRLLQRFVDRGIPGAALSVYRGEKKLYEGFCGYRDLARTRPLTADTLFRMHSITKVYSSLCGMMEYERGAFLMDDPVYE
jgi:CubicO group peptidase (beta-lactamase class C family)